MSYKIKTEYTIVKQNTLCWVMPVCYILYPITEKTTSKQK